jgi:hypothetical protein
MDFLTGTPVETHGCRPRVLDPPGPSLGGPGAGGGDFSGGHIVMKCPTRALDERPQLFHTLGWVKQKGQGVTAFVALPLDSRPCRLKQSPAVPQRRWAEAWEASRAMAHARRAAQVGKSEG